MQIIKEKVPVSSYGTSQQIYEFLNAHPVGVLATISLTGYPYGSVIYYAVDSSLTVRFITKRHTEKSDNLRHNNHAVLVVFDEVSQTTVQIKGIVSEITNTDDVNKVFRNSLRASLHTSQNVIPPISRLIAGEYVAYKLKATETRMAVYSKRQ